jgi:competence protein ComEC
MSDGARAIDLRLAAPAAGAWLVTGLLVGAPALGAPAAIALWCVAGLALGAATLRRGRRGGAFLAAAALVVAAGALVATSVAVQAPARAPAVLVAAAETGRPLTLLLTTTETLEAGGTDDASQGDRAEPFSATITAVLAPARAGGEAPVGIGTSVQAVVFAAAPSHRTGIGSALLLRATVEQTSPGDAAAFLVFGSAAARVTAQPPWYLDWANGLRSGFAQTAATLPGDGGDLLPGLAIGDTAAVDERLDEAMKASSLSHLTAVSGSNCAVVVGLIMLLGATVGMGRRARILASALVLVAFVVLVTPQASVVRAAVMALVVLLAMLSGRPVRGVPVLSLAVVVVLAGEPWLSRDYGFALSVLATGGLLVLAGPLAALLARALPRPIAVVVAVPLAAQCACQPLLVLLQPSLPLYGVLANVMAEPAAPVATVVGLLACVLLPVVPPLGQLLAAVAWLPAAWIAAVAAFCAGLPAAALPWPGGPGGALLLAAVTVLALMAAVGPLRPALRRWSAVVALAALVGSAGAMTGARVARQLALPDDWQVAACDIGQGDAVLLRSAGRIALVDTGPDDELLAACLDALGIGRIDLLVLSHFDLDHVGGAAAVLGRSERVLVGPPSDAADGRLIDRLAAGGATVERVDRGASGVFGELRWTVLWPRAGPGGEPVGVEPGNDASVTLAFEPVGRCAGGCLSSLFLGDLGERSQARVLAAGGVPRVDVVKVSHHGSADQSARMYERAAATVGVISVGADNDYGHPTDSLLAVLDATRTTGLRTDRDGLVLLSPGRAPGEVRVWTGGAAGGDRDAAGVGGRD